MNLNLDNRKKWLMSNALDKLLFNRETRVFQVFTFHEIITKLDEYLTERKMNLIDSRNPLVVICKNDALGDLLNVEAFEICQLNLFIIKHIIPTSEEI